jgi:cytochrome bd ubiquinol oxidase subunit I
MLSVLGFRDADAYVPGINDLVYGNPEQKIISAKEKIFLGRIALAALDQYREAKKHGNKYIADSLLKVFESDYRYMGYGYLDKPERIIPNVPLTFYSFRIMVMLGFYFILLFVVLLFFLLRNKLDNKKLILKLAILTFPLGYIASQAGWIIAEVGRQPWAIQDLLPTAIATSQINSSSVMITFILFAVLFTALLVAEIKIMLTAIKAGPKGGSHV